MAHLSYNEVPLQRGMFVFQLGTNGNEHMLFRYKVLELMDRDYVKISALADNPRIISESIKSVPAKNLHTDPKVLVEDRIVSYKNMMEKDLPAKINNISEILNQINSGIAYTITGSEFSSDVEI